MTNEEKEKLVKQLLKSFAEADKEDEELEKLSPAERRDRELEDDAESGYFPVYDEDGNEIEDT